MMSDVVISIIVVSLNTKIDFLKTLHSIQEQKFDNYEVIVVDGGSTDGTIEEIERNKEFISKYITQKDKGIYDAMNKGIDISIGSWIIFLNSGDIFFNNKVLENINFGNLKNKEIIFGETLVDNNNIKYLVNSKKFNNKTVIMPFCHQSCFVRSDVLKKEKFSLEYKISADFDFFLKCYLKNMNFFNSNLIISQIQAGGLSDRFRQNVLKENISILKTNEKKKYIYLIYYLKIFDLIKSCIKFFLLNNFLNFLLIIKYKKKLFLK